MLSSPRGIGILAQSPTARPEGKEGDARVGPPHTHYHVVLDELAYRADGHLVGYEQELLIRKVHAAL